MFTGQIFINSNSDSISDHVLFFDAWHSPNKISAGENENKVESSTGGGGMASSYCMILFSDNDDVLRGSGSVPHFILTLDIELVRVNFTLFFGAFLSYQPCLNPQFSCNLQYPRSQCRHSLVLYRGWLLFIKLFVLRV